MTPKKRLQIDIAVFIISCAALIFFLVNISQPKTKINQPDHLPQTLKERLKTFIPEDSMTFDQTDPDQLIILWKDINIKFGSPQENLNQKIIVLKALFPIIQSRAEQIEYVDLRYPENASIKYSKEAMASMNAGLE